MKLSTGLVNAVMATGSLRSTLNGFELRAYSGTEPATADDAIGGAVLIGKYDNGGSPDTFAATAADGVLSKNSGETLSGTSAAAGTMAFFRLVLASDDGSASTSAPRIQGPIGLVGMPVVVPNTVVSASGVTLPPISALVIRMPKQ